MVIDNNIKRKCSVCVHILCILIAYIEGSLFTTEEAKIFDDCLVWLTTLTINIGKMYRYTSEKLCLAKQKTINQNERK